MSGVYSGGFVECMHRLEGGLLECCLQRTVPRRLLERDPFQCSVECEWSGSFYTVDHYRKAVGREEL